MRLVLALLVAAAGIAVLFATASRPERGAGTPRLFHGAASSACYRTTWSKGFTPVTTSVPCPAQAAAPAVLVLANGQVVTAPPQGSQCTTTSGTETIVTPTASVKTAWACETVSASR